MAEIVRSAFSHFLSNRLHQIRNEDRDAESEICFFIHCDCWRLNPIERKNLLVESAIQPIEPTSIVKGKTVHPFDRREWASSRYLLVFLISASITFSSSGTVSSAQIIIFLEGEYIMMSGRRLESTPVHDGKTVRFGIPSMRTIQSFACSNKVRGLFLERWALG